MAATDVLLLLAGPTSRQASDEYAYPDVVAGGVETGASTALLPARVGAGIEPSGGTHWPAISIGAASCVVLNDYGTLCTFTVRVNVYTYMVSTSQYLSVVIYNSANQGVTAPGADFLVSSMGAITKLRIQVTAASNEVPGAVSSTLQLMMSIDKSLIPAGTNAATDAYFTVSRNGLQDAYDPYVLTGVVSPMVPVTKEYGAWAPHYHLTGGGMDFLMAYGLHGTNDNFRATINTTAKTVNFTTIVTSDGAPYNFYDTLNYTSDYVGYLFVGDPTRVLGGVLLWVDTPKMRASLYSGTYTALVYFRPAGSVQYPLLSNNYYTAQRKSYILYLYNRTNSSKTVTLGLLASPVGTAANCLFLDVYYTTDVTTDPEATGALSNFAMPNLSVGSSTSFALAALTYAKLRIDVTLSSTPPAQGTICHTSIALDAA